MQRDEEDDSMTDHEANRPEEEQVADIRPEGADVQGLSAAKDAEIEAAIDRLKRLQAEFDNYKKRIARENEALRERISDREILDFLPLYDNLERAFTVYAKDRDVDSLVAGVEQIFGQFAQILEQKRVKRIPAVGQTFDPERHEALLSLESEEEKYTILEEFSPGYVRDGRTLLPSKVAVSQGASTGEEETK
jgi:molecular chaperone GrpE